MVSAIIINSPSPLRGEGRRESGGVRGREKNMRPSSNRVARPSAQSGFTLIELLVVVTIVGMLAGIAMVNVLHANRKAAEAVLRADLHELRKALDNFYADKQRYPAALSELVEGKYMRRIPADPITKSAETWVEVIDEADAEELTESTEPTGPGVSDVKSGAEGETLDGIPYGEL